LTFHIKEDGEFIKCVESKLEKPCTVLLTLHSGCE